MDLNNIKMDVDTGLVFNIGYPMKNSNAPIAYNSLFASQNMNMLMLPLEVPKGGLPELLKACRTMNVHYLCPTMPHKSDIIPLLDDVDELSKVFNSVNAVKIDMDGTSHGIGMDGRGVTNALLESNTKLEGASVMLIGSGAICGVIGLELSRQGVQELHILNRTVEKAQVIADRINMYTSMKAYAYPLTSKNLKLQAAQADVLVQATPLGMKGYGRDYEDLSFIDALPEHSTVMDVVLNPPCTALRQRAMERGLKTIPGMKMLLGQMDAIFDYLWDVKLTAADKEACTKALCVHLGVDAPV